VRRERRVPDHAGRHVEDDRILVDPFRNVRRFLGDGTDQRIDGAANRSPALLPEPDQPHLVGGAVERRAAKPEAERERSVFEVRPEMDFRLFGDPIGSFERLEQPPRVRCVRFATGDSGSPLVAVPPPLHASSIDYRMSKVPLLAGTRLVVVSPADDAVTLRPPPPAEAIADVRAAVRDALRFPLAGPPLEALVPRSATRATIVVEPPSLPIPGSERDPRQEAIAAAVIELERLGIPSGYQTLFVAGGLARRAGHELLSSLVSPEFARRFHGHVEVHDVERDDLVELEDGRPHPLRIHRALVETDVVVVVTAAETVLHGGPAALMGAAGREALRSAGAWSLLETSASQGWRTALAIERALSRRVPLIGASLVLNHPRAGGAARGYPYETEALERIAGSPFRPVFSAIPGGLRAAILRSLPLERTAAAAFAGPPSVAHAEALLRGVELRSTVLDGQLDAICIGIPRTTPHLPRERPNPVLVASLGLGLALRLWRDSFPLRGGGTAILLSRFQRRFAHPTQQPYRALFAAARGGPDPAALARAEEAALADPRALESYRAGRTVHPLLPFVDWSGCASPLSQLGNVLIAGCRDATAARSLGFVPTHGLGAALTMVRGWSDRPPRVGFLLAPPYFPLRVTSQ
jgi:Lactate racemase N-terminal domain